MKKHPVIFKDPVYGFVSVPSGTIFKLVEHPFFQRLRRIYQLGLTHLVYPGAVHTRFQHAIGALHLMGQAIAVLRLKGHDVSPEEEEASYAAILLHDIGHGPFSHTLEKVIVAGVSHEALTSQFMQYLNKKLGGELDLAIEIFENRYEKHFLHQLINSQLDVDRLDYLNRDSFYTGVQEGVIGSERIIKMFELHENNIVVEYKGIYSIENFIIARRLMYWQVYLHKTVIAAEQMVIRIIDRAKYLIGRGVEVAMPSELAFFLSGEKKQDQGITSSEQALHFYALLDDHTIYGCVKAWMEHPDKVLAELCNRMINRELLGVRLQTTPFEEKEINAMLARTQKKYGYNENEANSLVFTDVAFNHAYDPEEPLINILFKDGSIKDIAKASDQLNISVLSQAVKKYYICYPKELGE